MIASSTYQMVATSVVLSCTVAEILCYIAFFHHVICHDNGPIKANLRPEVTKQRNRTNAISFLGQFYGFATEATFLTAYLVIIATDDKNTEMKALAVVFKFMEFGVLSLVEILASEQLRRMMFQDLRVVKSAFTLF